MAGDFLGIGWKFPVRVDTDGRIAMSEYEEDIKEAIYIVLSTAKGERIMRPEFGCGIHEMVFAPLDTATLTLMEKSVKEALIRWEQRIDLLDIAAEIDDSENGKVLISITYRVRKTNNRFNLVYPYYLKGER